MKIHFNFEELPKHYQDRFTKGFKLNEAQNFHPASTQFWLSLICVILFGFPGSVVVILGFYALIEKSFFNANSMLKENPDTNSWLLFIGLSVLAIAGLVGVTYLVLKLFKWFWFHKLLRTIKKEKGIINYGLLLEKDLVFRPTSNNQTILIPKKAILRTERHTKRIEKQKVRVNHIIYFDKTHQKEFYVEIENSAIDPEYTNGKNLITLVNNWINKS